MIINWAVAHLHQKAKRKAKEEEYVCVVRAVRARAPLTNFILGMPAMMEEGLIDLEEEFR
jgi:hypothetical protein